MNVRWTFRPRGAYPKGILPSEHVSVRLVYNGTYRLKSSRTANMSRSETLPSESGEGARGSFVTQLLPIEVDSLAHSPSVILVDAVTRMPPVSPAGSVTSGSEYPPDIHSIPSVSLRYSQREAK